MYDTIEIENNILEFWNKNKIFDKLRKKNKGKKIFSFIDGPITANNPMGVHHAWGRTYKDIYQRFKAMQGYDQRFQNGFDCQGLHVEVETEKELGFNSKKDIEKFGLDKFSEASKKRVLKYADIQTKQSIRLGQWMDWKNSYYTMSDENIEHIWNFLHKCHKNKWLYQGTKVLPWCHRCGTSLAHHELVDAYKEISHLSAYLKFRIKGKNNEYLLVWSTTPWTFSSNVAAAVNPDLNYVQIKKAGNIYYIAEKAASTIGGDYIVLDHIKGKKLIGLQYESLYPDFEAQKGIKHRVIPWKDVGEEEGTGIVHIAPGCGAEDLEIGKKEKLQEICPIDENGYFLEGFGFLTGKHVSEITDQIIEDLGKRDILFKTKPYKHRYPTCWRCSTELVFRLVDEYFISVNKVRPSLKKEAKKVEWYPEHVGKLMQDWLNNMSDWGISRKRYWGLPLPIWKCENGHEIIISSKKELVKKAKSGIKQLKELHRPWIDDVILKCPDCKGDMHRIPDVGDCWLDAGIVPYSTLHYLSDKRYWRKWFPAELIIEMREQVRLWFYSLLFMSVTLEGKTPYKKVLSYEKVNDELGRPMHKSWGNAIWFDDAVEKMGADVMRWIYTKQNPMFNLNFGYKLAEENKKILTMLFNISRYIDQAISLNKYKKSKPKKLQVEDRWILSNLNTLLSEVTKNLESLKPHVAANLIEDFFTERLSRRYIQYIRDRVQGTSGENKDAALYTLYDCHLTLLKIIAPFVPFLAEDIYQKYFRKYEKKESIHLFDWPRQNKNLIEKKLEDQFEIAKEVIQTIFSMREEAKIGVRWPLGSATIITKEKKVILAVKKLKKLIKDQTNVKEIYFQESGKGLEFRFGKLKVNTQLTPELELEGFHRELKRRIQNKRKKAGLHKKDRIELEIISDLDLERYKDDLKEAVGAKTLEFIEKKKKYKFSSKEKIKNKEFKISFNVI